MNANTIISILIPNYNRGDLLGETLDSCLSQTYPHWEAIVVDDGSGDSSDEVGKAYAKKDGRISYEKRTNTPAGAPTCRNQAFLKSKGDYVIFLDSDDLLAPFCLEQRIKQLNAYLDHDFLVFPMLMFKGNPANAGFLWNKETEKPDLNRFLELDAVWQTTGPVWKRQAVENIGGFTPGLACWQDVDFHLKALTAGLKYRKMYHLLPDAYYRQHDSGSISQHEISSPEKMLSRQQIFLSNLEKFGQPLPESLKESLRVFGRNVVIGAIKTLNYEVAGKVVAEAKKTGVFKKKHIREFMILKALFASRLNRIGTIGRKIDDFIAKGRKPSLIGKTAFKPSKKTE